MMCPLAAPAPPLIGQTVEQRLMSSAGALRDAGLLSHADYHRTINRIRAMRRIQEGDDADPS